MEKQQKERELRKEFDEVIFHTGQHCDYEISKQD